MFVINIGGVWLLNAVSIWLAATGRARVPYHLLGPGVALVLQLAIVGYVLRNRRHLAQG